MKPIIRTLTAIAACAILTGCPRDEKTDFSFWDDPQPQPNKPSVTITEPTRDPYFFTDSAMIRVAGTSRYTTPQIIVSSSTTSPTTGQVDGAGNWWVDVSLEPGQNFITVRMYGAYTSGSASQRIMIERTM